MLVPNFLKENVKVPNKLIYNDQDIIGMGKKLRKKKMPAFSIYSDLQEVFSKFKISRPVRIISYFDFKNYLKYIWSPNPLMSVTGHQL